MECSQVCDISLDNCPPSSISNNGTVCYCTHVSSDGSVYKFFIRALADPSISGDPLTATYDSLDVLTNGIGKTENIGTLPLMFGKFSYSNIFIFLLYHIYII